MPSRLEGARHPCSVEPGPGAFCPPGRRCSRQLAGVAAESAGHVGRSRDHPLARHVQVTAMAQRPPYFERSPSCLARNTPLVATNTPLLRTLRPRPHLRLKLKRQHRCLSATPAARQNRRRRLEHRRHGGSLPSQSRRRRRSLRAHAARELPLKVGRQSVRLPEDDVVGDGEWSCPVSWTVHGLGLMPRLVPLFIADRGLVRRRIAAVRLKSARPGGAGSGRVSEPRARRRAAWNRVRVRAGSGPRRSSRRPAPSSRAPRATRSDAR